MFAESYYVSPSGADSNPGTSPSQPILWIQTAINKSKAGDTIFLLPGTHKVKPGDKNITFSGKKGKEGAPITLTTAGAGVLVDLSGAEVGWGGFRISDGSEWIVVDGGGDPNPFDEFSYHLTLMNAGYESATGDGRSGIVCRPVTIQGAAHITVRNLFGKRSMGGMGIFGQATRNILVEKCRLQPGEHAHDGGASHGIYVGAGADDVLIKHTFIRWGGDGRLGVQNNHGGDKNVVLEECFITECQGAIKAFNGGGVKVKNCWFWNIDEKPGLQGNYAVDGLIRTPPAPDFIAKLGTAAAASSVAKDASAKPGASSSAQPSAPKTAAGSLGEGRALAAAQTPPQLDASDSVAALQKLIQTAGTKNGLKLKLKIFGSLEDVGFVSAGPTGVKVDFKGNTMPVRWKDIESQDLAQAAYTLMTDDQEALFNAGRIAVADRNEPLYEKIFNRLMEVSSARGMSLDDLKAGR
ncbi:MAG: right-handed parallel beta-helix repeat-containing protein [Planctomycetes bacterium]|nr:right-handed parallel beta-helix repeat-containing protein [Planctomycetota bacterium]